MWSSPDIGKAAASIELYSRHLTVQPRSLPCSCGSRLSNQCLGPASTSNQFHDDKPA